MLLLIIVIYKNGIFLFSSFVTPQLYKTVFAISTGNCWLFIYFQTHQYCIFLRILIECFADSIVYESFSRIKCSCCLITFSYIQQNLCNLMFFTPRLQS